MKKKLLRLALQTAAVILLAVLLVLVAGGSPLEAGYFFVYGIFGSLNGFAEIMVKATPLIFVGLGVSVAFSTGFFNIGGEGQLYMGALVSAMITLWLPVPGLVRVLLAIVASFLAGGFWAFIPAYLKNRMGISETVNTIMFNYIAITILGIAVRGFLQDPSGNLPQSARIPAENALPLLLPPTRLHLGFFIAVACAFILWFIMRRTTLGYELRISGSNRRGAACAGIPVQRSLLLAAVISGGLAGMAGMSELLGVQRRLLENLSGGNGYTAILVALLARNHPLAVVGVSIGFAALQVGANTMQRQMGIPASIVSILTGFIVVMILSKDFLKFYREHRQQKGRAK